jgi:hypothetical protein
MLLSVERPFVGALALLIPGAAPRHGNGLVLAVLPASTEHGERTLGVRPDLVGTRDALERRECAKENPSRVN